MGNCWTCFGLLILTLCIIRCERNPYGSIHQKHLVSGDLDKIYKNPTSTEPDTVKEVTKRNTWTCQREGQQQAARARANKRVHKGINKELLSSEQTYFYTLFPNKLQVASSKNTNPRARNQPKSSGISSNP